MRFTDDRENETYIEFRKRMENTKKELSAYEVMMAAYLAERKVLGSPLLGEVAREVGRIICSKIIDELFKEE